ncbi:MAG TPA: hypothetical protein VNP96_06645 [Solirubrobacterales bacterium]|nr:hypothetical protein [Solirubrobacterales bacterium]
MGRGKGRAVLLTALIALLVASGTASAIKFRGGDLVITANGGFTPTALPKYRDAPITLYGGGKISTVSGKLPPILEKLALEFDRHGSVQTTGLPVCTGGRLEATTVPAARRNCPGAIVGKGRGSAIVKFPEQAPIPISSPITLFNGPKVRGFDSVLAHAYTTVPVPTTFVVPVVIEKINKGVYGYRTEATIPVIAGGAGVPISGSLRIGKRWTYKGKRYSFVNARCETGHLQARGEFSFKDGTFLSGTIVRGCQVRK